MGEALWAKTHPPPSAGGICEPHRQCMLGKGGRPGMQTGAPGEGCLHPDRQGDGACIPTGRGTMSASRQAGGRCLHPDRQGDGGCSPTGRGTVPASRQAGGRCLQPDRQEKDTCSPTGRGTVPASRQAALPFSLKPPAQIYLPPSKDVNCTLLKSWQSAIYMSSLEKFLLRSSAHFFDWAVLWCFCCFLFFVFNIELHELFVYILEINPLSATIIQF